MITPPAITPLLVAELLVEGERWPVYVHVIDHPAARVLVDTGMTELHPEVADMDPRLVPLSEQAFDLAGVDVVVNTHLHFDHCGWNARRAGERVVPTFPRARYFVQRGEWDHALGPTERDRASYIADFFRPAEAQTEFLDGEGEIVPGIRVEVVPGHNRNMQCVWIESRGQQACFISDLVPMRLHLAYPWIMSLDLYPMETLANKKRMLPQLLKQRALVIFPHDPDVPWARLAEAEGKITAVSVDGSS